MAILCVDDASFGPVVQGCRSDFDFTLKFEKIILSILPSAVFIGISVPRIIFLALHVKLVDGVSFQFIKLFGKVAAAVYTILQLAILILSCSQSFELPSLSITANVLSFIAAIFISILSFMEHSRSPRPSILLSAFLSLTVLFDIAQVRTMWLLYHAIPEITYLRLFTAAIAVKAVLFLLESLQRRIWLKWDWREHSPEETAGLYGLGSFLWLGPLFKLGFQKVLNVSDLFPIDSSISVERVQASFSQHSKGHNFQDERHGLTKALARTLFIPFLLPVAPRIVLIGFTLCQPFLIEAILRFLEETDTRLTTNKGYGLIGATILVYTGIPIATALYWYSHERALFMTRACLISAIYQQTIRGPISASEDSAAITLMSADVERVQMGFMQLHEFWANLVQIAIVCFLLHRQLGAAFAAPLVVVFACIICSSILMRLIGPKQAAWMQAIQKRVGHTANIIGNMKHLKISGLTKAVENSTQSLRIDELKAGGKFRVFLVCSIGIGFTPVLLGPVFAFALTSRQLNATSIFTSLSYLQLLLSPLSMLFQIAPHVLVALSCLTRIQQFIMKELRSDTRQFIRPDKSPKKEHATEKSPSGVEIRNANFGWKEGRLALRNINISISKGLTIVIGPVASGKSTLCKAFLGETPISSGEILIRSRSRHVGYCDQLPFLPNQSIREIITAFSTFDEDRYVMSLKATMLSEDLLLFPKKDKTKVGSDGLALSGGQKKRIALARALYMQCDLLVLDDVLGGLDAKTEEQIFYNVFGPSGLLKGRETVVLLSTHAVKYLPFADHIVVLGSNGTVVEQGRFHELVANQQYVFGLGIRADVHHIPSSTAVRHSKIETEVQIQAESPLFSAKSEESSMAEPQIGASNRAMGDLTVFSHYGRNIGAFWLTAFLFLSIICGFLFNFPMIWLSYWSSDSFNRPRSLYIGIYALFQVLALTAILGEALIGLILIIRNSGFRLHETALRTVVSAPLRFFSQTETGTVINLFSQDMTLLDGELPQALINTSLQTWITIGGAAVAATPSPYIITTYPFVILILYMVQRFYLCTSRQIRLLDLEAKSPLYTHFLDTIKGLATIRAFDWTENFISANNDLLDTSQRPAYLLSMIQRCLAFVLGTVVAVIALLVVVLATQLRPSTGFTGASMVSIMSLGKTLSSLVQMYTLLETSIGAVSRLKSFSEQTLPEDLPGEDIRPPALWPEKGRIEVQKISASYCGAELAADVAKSENLALRDLTFTIEAGQKVAICGRTGSGKSSIVLLLLRLLDPLSICEGDLIIDEVSLLRMDRSTLRERIIAVPQDPTFFPDGTSFKKNLDPFNEIGEDECQQVLEMTEIWASVSIHGGINAGLTADALSQGQKQLFSLARAVLRRRVRSHLLIAEAGENYLELKSSLRQPQRGGGVLILDEVSSSTDRETQKTIQKIISQEFEGYTVIMVSHLLDVIKDFDQVMVMEEGVLVEKGSPLELINHVGSRFKGLWTAEQGKHGCDSEIIAPDKDSLC
ncbi:hypothetical protein N7495_004938 [Penicillium taxi]|uniref:uncharacterized protein n=1 Tax=Penicillium taxi TaxID=168475 RepID=UPI002544F441|nr:uncharacterized protein N7495_004938 [Penicillium taxi]KAJ5893247.1 hypothetical protein N7495_004938 [Penicillium taxi]